MTDESWGEKLGVQKRQRESTIGVIIVKGKRPGHTFQTCVGGGRLRREWKGDELNNYEITISSLCCLEGGSYQASVGSEFGKRIGVFCLQDRELESCLHVTAQGS